jgi:hypothetical protein
VFTVNTDPPHIASITAVNAHNAIKITVTRDLAHTDWTHIDVERSVGDASSWEAMRGGVTVPAPDDAGVLHDWEMPQGVPLWYRARGIIRSGDIVIAQGAWLATTTPVVWDGGAGCGEWLREPGNPAGAVMVDLVVTDELTTTRHRVGLLDVIGRASPVAVWDMPALPTGVMQVATHTAAQEQALRRLVRSASVLLYQGRPSWGHAHRWIVVTEHAVTRIPDASAVWAEWRQWAISWVEVSEPPVLPGRIPDPPFEETCESFSDDFERSTIGSNWEQLPFEGVNHASWSTDGHSVSESNGVGVGVYVQDALLRVGDFGSGAQFCEATFDNVWPPLDEHDFGLGLTNYYPSAEVRINVDPANEFSGNSFRVNPQYTTTTQWKYNCYLNPECGSTNDSTLYTTALASDTGFSDSTRITLRIESDGVGTLRGYLNGVLVLEQHVYAYEGGSPTGLCQGQRVGVRAAWQGSATAGNPNPAPTRGPRVLDVQGGCLSGWNPDVSPPVDCTAVLTEPFDNYTANGWVLTSPAPTIVAGRTGTAGNFFSTTQRADYNIPAPAQSDTVTIGFALRRTDTIAAGRNICQWYSDGGTVEHMRMQWSTPTGALNVLRAATTIATATVAFNQDQWYYIEVQSRLHDTAGFVRVRINGVDVINATGLDTKNVGTSTVYEQIRLNCGLTSATSQYDDLYLTTGSECVFQGDPIPGCTAVLTEPFDNLTAWASTSTPAIVTGRTGTAAEFNSLSDAAAYTIPTGSRADTITVGFAWRWTDANSLQRVAVELWSDDNTVRQSKLVMLSGATKQLTVTNGTTAIGGAGTSANNAVAGPNTWQYVEWQTKIHDSAGFHVVRVNGVEVISVAGIDTRNGGNGIVDTVRIGDPGNAGRVAQYDDLYLTTGSACTLQGDPTWQAAFKTALGTAVDTVSGSTLVITTTAAIAVGDLVVVRVAADNLSASTPTFTCSDSGGNAYTVHQQIATQATAAAGVAGGIICTKATTAIATGGTITVTLSGAVAARAAYAESFAGMTNTTRSTPVGSTTTNGAVGPLTTGTVNAGDLVAGWAATESNAVALTADTDTLGGPWSTIVALNNAAGGTGSTRVQVGGQWKIPTTADAQVWGTGGASADAVGGVVVLKAGP